jgi:acyl-CoA synthetase (AMP-forming)/AMP-acid ligase II
MSAIASQFELALKSDPKRPFLITSTTSWSYADFWTYLRSACTRLQQYGQNRIACCLSDSPQSIALVLAAGLAGKSLVQISHSNNQKQLDEILAGLDCELLVHDLDDCSGLSIACTHIDALLNDVETLVPATEFCAEEEIEVLTSGTTGKPKSARYRWQDLLAQVRRTSNEQQERWLLAYRLNHFAGLQMLAHVLANKSTLVMCETTAVSDALKTMSAMAVTHVSSTPTFWRFALALQTETGESLQLQHISLGSEPVSANLLEQLSAAFPRARLVHIYASTEAGSCISVSDGLAGLPAEILERDDSADVQFRIEEGELLIKSEHGMRHYRGQPEHSARDSAGWLATGDLVEVVEGRIEFLGRRSETINVGGVKVHPLEVENLVSTIPGVKLARVFGQDNPVVGQIVAVEIVIAAGADEQQLEDQVRQVCSRLPRPNQPRSITFVDTIETNNLKLSRQ